MTLQEAYAALGLKSGATPAEARKAYHKLVLLHHPDRGGSAAALQRATEAYGIVVDPGKATMTYDPSIVTPFFRKPT